MYCTFESLIRSMLQEKDGKKLFYWDELPGNRNPFFLGDLLELRKNADDMLRFWKYRTDKASN